MDKPSLSRNVSTVNLRYPALLCLLVLAGSCGRSSEVTVYCALDQVFAEPILNDFEKETGIHINAAFDIEANKTVGLVRTLIEEKNHPRCDVFWNNEIAQTIRLKKAGVLDRYISPSASGIPAEFRDRDGYWTGFAARARIFIVNTNLVPENRRPKSLRDLADPIWKGKSTVAKPLTGTTTTHFAALFSLWGEKKASAFCRSLLTNEVNLAQGNAHVSKLVAQGEVPFGLTDTDDYAVRLQEGSPVAAVYPDAEGEGTLVIPNSLALVAGAPNSANGKKLIDWLLRPEIEARLAAGPSAQIPLRPGVERPKHVLSPGEFRAMAVDWEKVADELDRRAEFLRETFAR